MHLSEECVDEGMVGTWMPAHELRAERGRRADVEERESYCFVGGWDEGFEVV